MIVISQAGIQLVMPIHNLQQLMFLQEALIASIQTEANSSSDVDGSVVIGPLAEVLGSTLFNQEQMDAIEDLLRSKAAAPERTSSRQPAHANAA